MKRRTAQPKISSGDLAPSCSQKQLLKVPNKDTFDILHLFLCILRHCPNTNHQIPPTKAKWISIASVVEPLSVLTLETIRKIHRFCTQTFKFASFLLSDSLGLLSDVEHCNFPIEKGYYMPDSFAFDYFEPSYSQKFSKIFIKKQH